MCSLTRLTGLSGREDSSDLSLGMCNGTACDGPQRLFSMFARRNMDLAACERESESAQCLLEAAFARSHFLWCRGDSNPKQNVDCQLCCSCSLNRWQFARFTIFRSASAALRAEQHAGGAISVAGLVRRVACRLTGLVQVDG